MVEFIPIKPNTQEWLRYRLNGIGASENAIILGINEWETPMRLFAEKVGLEPMRYFSNERTTWGKIDESNTLNMWQYWDKDYVENWEKGRKIREIQIPDGIYVNDRFPWLFCTPDGIGSGHTLDGEKVDLFPVEAKNIDPLTYIKYGGLPPYYELQIQQQMIVMESQYAEFAYRKGLGEFCVVSREFDPLMAEEIIESTYNFWYKKVLPARKLAQELVNERKMAVKKALYGEIQKLEPDPDSTNAYRDYMISRFTGEYEKMVGDESLLRHAKRAEFLKQLINRLEKAHQYEKNCLLQAHQQNQVKMIDFGDFGKSSYNKKHMITLSNKPSEDRVLYEYEKLNFNY